MRLYDLNVIFDAVHGVELSTLLYEIACRTGGFEYQYWKSIAPPNSIKIIHKSLSENGVENLKEFYRGMKLDNGYFTVTEREKNGK